MRSSTVTGVSGNPLSIGPPLVYTRATDELKNRSWRPAVREACVETAILVANGLVDPVAVTADAFEERAAAACSIPCGPAWIG